MQPDTKFAEKIIGFSYNQATRTVLLRGRAHEDFCQRFFRWGQSESFEECLAHGIIQRRYCSRIEDR